MGDKKKKKAPKIVLCSKSDCKKRSQEVYDALKQELAARGLADAISLKRKDCIGECKNQPAAVVKPKDKCFKKIKLKKVGAVVDEAAQALVKD